MNLVAITRVKNEIDIIEAFVRHHSIHFDKLIISDDGSTDGTYEALLALQASGLPLVLLQEPTIGYEQARQVTRLLHLAVNDFGADWIMPLDADEFVETKEGTTPRQLLQLRPAELAKVAWHTFVWRPEDDERLEPNPITRIRLRMPASPDHLGKVLIPRRLVASGIMVAQGSHNVTLDGEILPAQLLETVHLCHFPIRSVQQYAAKIAIGYLQYQSMPNWDRASGFHYIAPFHLLTQGIDKLAESMTAQSRRYSLDDDWPETGEPAERPLRYQGGALRLATDPVMMLPNLLHFAEAIVNQLAKSRSQPHLSLVGFENRTPSAAKEKIIAAASQSISKTPVKPKHRFQSFWSGGPLSPYESLCLGSFLMCGHAFDLYTYDSNLIVPPGVRVRDASEVLNYDEFFVYEDGFGRGSPAGFANLFRYRLLAEKGGWWVDTDVLCRSIEIPEFRNFFAREDTGSINIAVLYFEPHHPLMQRCLEEAKRMARPVRWGDTGPFLFTRIVDELGYSDQVLPSSVCYPVHYSEALDILRPSMCQSASHRAESAYFVHIWNQMLQHHGVQKTLLPPRGSILRRWVDQYPMGGWTGEYDESALDHAVAVQAQRNALVHEITEVRAKLEGATRDADKTKDVIQELQAELIRSRAEVLSLYHSTSWRVMGPLRAASQLLGRLKTSSRRSLDRLTR
jgi:hypothetical protein